MQNPFLTRFEQLPFRLPIFPLQNALVLPGAQLPLNIFEPRYLEMVQDSLASHHLIGMVQPLEAVPLQENPALYQTGSAGRITSYRETLDGRMEIILTGVCRFDITQEIAASHSYRIVEPDWRRFASDYELSAPEDEPEKPQLLNTLDSYLKANNLELNREALEELPFAQALNVLTTLLPLPHIDKQHILETVPISDRYLLLTSSMEMMSGNSDVHLRH
jgi:uncharacterized protein